MPPSTLTENIKIQNSQSNGDSLRREVSRSLSMSTSPQESFHHRKMSMGLEGTSPGLLRKGTGGAARKQLKPFREQDIKILLLENVNQTGRDLLQGQGYQVEFMKGSLPEDQLIEKIKYGSIPVT
jgi:D-3-phosphoglycerate dehydrogenase